VVPLREHWTKHKLLDTRVFVHDPGKAGSYKIPERTSEIRSFRELQSPWLLWMREALGDRSVDLVHFLCHGYMSDMKGALAFAESPLRNNDPRWSRFVGSDEINTLLTQVGAWSVAFDSPRDNFSEMGLRAVADALAQTRPGPALHHESRLDDAKLSELGGAFRFLFDPSPSVPQSWRSIAVCCQPFRVAHYQEEVGDKPGSSSWKELGTALRRILRPEATVKYERPEPSITETPNVPAWLAAAQRYVEQKEFEIKQVRKATLGQNLVRSNQELRGVERGLGEIEKAIRRISAKSSTKAKA
jgi:hypothetical protein